MKFSYAEATQTHMRRQRNLLIMGSGLSLLTNVLLTTALLLKSERIIVIPPELKQEVWLEKNRVSGNYLEETALFMTHLLLDKSPGQHVRQDTILLRHVASEAYGKVRTLLMAEEERRERENLSTEFVMNKIEVAPQALKAYVSGQLIGFVNSERVTQNAVTYVFSFKLKGGKLWLVDFKEKEK